MKTPRVPATANTVRYGIGTAICLLSVFAFLSSRASAQTAPSAALPELEAPSSATTPMAGAALGTTAPTTRSRYAGAYGHFNGFSGRWLNLWPNGTYFLQYSVDMIDPKDPTFEKNKSYGAWSVQNDGSIVIEPRDSKRKWRLLDHSLHLYPIPWGGRMYLIGDNELANFRDAIIAHQEPHGAYRQPPFLLRDGDEKKQVTGLPSLPGRWATSLEVVKNTRLIAATPAGNAESALSALKKANIQTVSVDYEWFQYFRVSVPDIVRAEAILRTDAHKRHYDIELAKSTSQPGKP